MRASKKRFGAFVASALVAAAANVAIAANDPRAFDSREDGNSGPEPVTVAPGVGLTPPPTEPALPRNPLWAIPVKSLSATLERPLFSPSRRPARQIASPQIAPKVAAPIEPTEPPLNLLGVVAGSDDGHAVFINTTTHDIVRLRVGEGHDGWILQSVSGRQVVLEKNHRAATVTLPQPSASKK